MLRLEGTDAAAPSIRRSRTRRLAIIPVLLRQSVPHEIEQFWPCRELLRGDAEQRHAASAILTTVLIIAGHFSVAADRRDEYIAAFADLVRRARQAPGCLDVAVTATSWTPVGCTCTNGGSRGSTSAPVARSRTRRKSTSKSPTPTLRCGTPTASDRRSTRAPTPAAG